MKALPYILIVVIILIAGALYLQFGNHKNNLLKKQTTSNSQQKTISNNPLFSDYGPAPEFTGITKWLNSGPLKIADLKGKVILVDFWTYSCINCIRTIPYVTKWYDAYKDQGLVVIGVHTPEFAFEKQTTNVQAALERYKINHPVAQDNNYKTWSAYQNQFWPAHYLINQEGKIVYTHFGEGKYDITEKAIRTLLGLEGNLPGIQQTENNLAKTAEIYLGTLRLANSFANLEKPLEEEQLFFFPAKLPDNKFAIEGKWKFSPEYIETTANYSKLRLNFNASKVFMVAQSDAPVTLKIYIDGQPIKGVSVKDSDLYQLYNSEAGGNHILEIEADQPGIKIFTFTFG